jgi:hypothetical protein
MKKYQGRKKQTKGMITVEKKACEVESLKATKVS